MFRGSTVLGAVLLATVLLATGCLSDLRRPYPQKTVYALRLERPSIDANAGLASSEPVDDATRGAARDATAPATEDTLRVMRVRTAPLFERKGLVYRTGEETYDTDFYRELYAPPGIVLHQALVAWLERAEIARNIVSGGEMDPADWLLDVSIDELYFDLRAPDTPRVRFAAKLSLRDARDRSKPAALSRSYALEATADSKRGEALIRALERVLRETLERIESDLRGYFESDLESDLESPLGSTVGSSRPGGPP